MRKECHSDLIHKLDRRRLACSALEWTSYTKLDRMATRLHWNCSGELMLNGGTIINGSKIVTSYNLIIDDPFKQFSTQVPLFIRGVIRDAHAS